MKRRLMLASLAFITATAFVHADTLVLNDGRRLQGELLGVHGRDIEFEERGGGRRRTVRISRDEVNRIEFDRDSATTTGTKPLVFRRAACASARLSWTRASNGPTRNRRPLRSADLFHVQGETRWGRDRRDGAEGERNSPLNPNRPLPDRPAAALIGRIGDRNQIFFIGADAGPVPRPRHRSPLSRYQRRRADGQLGQSQGYGLVLSDRHHVNAQVPIPNPQSIKLGVGIGIWKLGVLESLPVRVMIAIAASATIATC